MEKSINPVMRKAKFTLPNQDVDKNIAVQVAEEIQACWNINKPTYINTLSNSIKGLNISIDNNDCRIRNEGNKAIVFDSPVMNIANGQNIFSARIITAICYDHYSTKNWTRISYLNDCPSDLNLFNELKDQYELITSTCCDISHKITQKALNKVADIESNSIGNCTIMTIGIEDPLLGKYLELFDDIDLQLKDIFTNIEAKQLIENYYQHIFNLKEVDPKKNKYDYHWITSPVSFINKLGFIIENNVLYNLRFSDNNIFANGIGYDDSKLGVLAKLSSLKIARSYTGGI